MRSLDPTPPTGTIRVRLALPTTGELWASARVVHAQPQRGFGVEFVNLPLHGQAALAGAVERLSDDRPA